MLILGSHQILARFFPLHNASHDTRATCPPKIRYAPFAKGIWRNLSRQCRRRFSLRGVGPGCDYLDRELEGWVGRGGYSLVAVRLLFCQWLDFNWLLFGLSPTLGLFLDHSRYDSGRPSARPSQLRASHRRLLCNWRVDVYPRTERVDT